MYTARGGIRGGVPPSHGYFTWERSFIIAAVVLTAVGLALLARYLQHSDGRVLARTGAILYFLGGVLIVASEATDLTRGFHETRLEAPVVSYIVLSFLAQVAIGGSLLQAGLLAAWIGWVTIVWSIGCLMVSAVTGSYYIPFEHHVMPLVIGIALLSLATGQVRESQEASTADQT
jgi:hypothetical protein